MQGLGLSHSGLLSAMNGQRHNRDVFADHGDSSFRPYLKEDGRTHAEHLPPITNHWNTAQSSVNGVRSSGRGKGHTRSGSTIDDLASAAIATTSPQLVNGSPRAYYTTTSPTAASPIRPSTSHLTFSSRFESTCEPPAKRIKSERLPAGEWTNNTPRPATSYEQSANLEDEVALLLGLRTEVNFKTKPSPAQERAILYQAPQHPAQQYFPMTQPQTAMPLTPPEEEPQPEIPPPAQAQASIPHAETDPHPNGVTPDRMDVDTLPPAAQAQDPTPTLPVPDPIPAPPPAVEVKKTRRVKPQVQAEVCSKCGKFQRDVDSGNTGITWIECSGCNRWFHANCVGLKDKAHTRQVDTFVCEQCEPEHGQTTFVRTSSRARTAIDYAELNQGLVKSSIETSMHHYINPIKQGKFAIQKDDFARIRPELLTVELMESMDNMKRPFVVPACWNPRFGVQRPQEVADPVEGPSKQRRFNSKGEEVEPDTSLTIEIDTETVIDCDQDMLDMVMPRDLTVRQVAEMFGKHEFVPVIDVKSQETKGQWTLEQWADYYEDPKEDKPIRNVISLEVSESPLGRLIRRPKVVRDLDLEDMVWDRESRAKQKKRYVQYYCLMSVKDSYTDFHIDFGGSSVYYHILKGTKTFFFIPPEDRYLKKYEEWCNSANQNDTWLPDMCNGAVTRVDLHEGDTAFIPAGWIHSVWTPEDSLVIGGNYLTRIDYELQLKVANVEKVTKVAPKFRYPFFQMVMWYTLITYLEEDPVPAELLEDFQDDPDYTFLRANPVWHEIGDLVNTAEPGAVEYNARYYPKTEMMGLIPLRDYLYRTARISADLPVPDINKRTIDAVKNSVPKGHGDPLVLIKTFAVWCAWKMGGMTAPAWVHSDDGGLPLIETKVKREQPQRVPGERASKRQAAAAQVQAQTQAKEGTGLAVVTPSKPATPVPAADSTKKVKSKASSPSAGRSSCDACRKKKIRCPHKEASDSPANGQEVPTGVAVMFSVDSQPNTFAPAVEGIAAAANEMSMASASLAQAALANTDQSYWDPNFRTLNGVVANPTKKSRTKACDECRKSKVSFSPLDSPS
jgi:F-box and leucine-rich repeat protein 10/11